MLASHGLTSKVCEAMSTFLVVFVTKTTTRLLMNEHYFLLHFHDDDYFALKAGTVPFHTWWYAPVHLIYKMKFFVNLIYYPLRALLFRVCETTSFHYFIIISIFFSASFHGFLCLYSLMWKKNPVLLKVKVVYFYASDLSNDYCWWWCNSIQKRQETGLPF